MSGFITNQSLWVATTFVDHVSDYVYVHLMQDLSLAETLLSKEAMEKVMENLENPPSTTNPIMAGSQTMDLLLLSIEKVKN